MRDCINTTPAMEAEEQLIAAAQQIVKALETNKTLTDDAKRILASLGSRLTSIASVSDTTSEESKDDEGLNEIDDQLNKIQDKIMNWEKEQSTMIWDFSPQEGYEYLKAVKKARKLIEILENRSPNSSEEVIWLHKAHDILQTAMARLEDEFRHLLVHNRQPFEPEHMSFRSTEEDIGSVFSSSDDSVEDLVHRYSIGRNSEEYVIDLVNRDVIPDLKAIARVMFESNYGRECSQVFIDVQKDALDDCLFILEVEKLSVEDVLKMDWNALNSKIRRWMRAMKIFVRVYLASEKLLSDQIFGEIEPHAGPACFAESSRAAISHLLSLPEAVAVGPHGPEKLIRILDMYEVLAGLVPDIAGLYDGHETAGPASSRVRTECEGVLRRLGGCARATFLEFENAVASNVSTGPFPGGGVHHVTRYVVNYMKTLVDYKKTLDEVLEESKNSITISPDRMSYTHSEDENVDENSFNSPTARRFRSLVSILERNLDEKSRLYKDEPLQHLFLTNNIHYMAEKVKNSELRTVLGDEWIRKHNWKFQQYAMSYERATWSSILALLKDDGLQNPGSNSISRTILKERLQSFYLAFEDVYKSQTGWTVPDQRLRDDLRISTSLKVIQAYRTFVGRHINHISEKYIKYSADDLEDFLLDLFEGSQKSLHGHKK